MKTYLKIQFSSEGELPSVIIKKLEKQGWRPIVGEKDFVMDWGMGESIGNSYLKKLDELHLALKGMGVQYTLYSSR